MGYGIKLRVFGEGACFSRPEMKVERVSYDVMTPSAARGILESIYWKPAIRWIIDKIIVLSEIKFGNIRRNEVQSKISSQKAKAAANNNDGTGLEIIASDQNERSQRATLYLKNVDYIICAHFEITDRAGETDDEKKHYNIAIRRMREGQCYKQPCFGTREFGANFEFIENDSEIPVSPLKGKKDLGYMLYDMDFKTEEDKDGNIIYLNDAEPRFYRPEMIDGVIDVAKYKKEMIK